MPPSTDYTKIQFSEQKAVLEAESIIQSLENYFPRIDDDIANLKENENKINELERVIDSSRAEIKNLKRQIDKKRQEIQNKLSQIIEMVKLHTQKEEVINACIELLSTRYEQFPRKSPDIYKNVNNMKKT